MVINSHVHFNTSRDFFFYSDYTIERFVRELDENNIDIALPSLNPKIGEMRCKNDCSFSCIINQNITNNNLQNCNCDYIRRHRGVVESHNGFYRLRCKTCGQTILTSKIDPLRKYNIELIRQTKNYTSRIKPLLYISLCESTIQNEINFYEENYKGLFCGYKFHPWTDQVSIRNFRIKTALPILIHTGLRECELAENAVHFAKNHPNNKVVIAHAAQLKNELLHIISNNDNMYLDCCPADFLFRNKEKCFVNYSKIESPEDIFYSALDVVGSKKIMFGRDSPWGSTSRELEIISNLKISNESKMDILYRTAQNVYL